MTQKPSAARRLTDLLRMRSTHGAEFSGKAQVQEEATTLQIVLEGGVLRQRFLRDGRRHTVAVYYRDDVINFGRFSGAINCEDDCLIALRGTVVGTVPSEAMDELRSSRSNTGLGGIGPLVYRELAIAQERTVSTGQRSALEALAHFFCETLVRCCPDLGKAGAAARCTLHISQDLIGTVLGISAVHVNRTLQELRRRKLADLIGNELIVYDREELAELAEFDDSYLAPI